MQINNRLDDNEIYGKADVVSRLMYGHNYQPTIHAIRISHAIDLSTAQAQMRSMFSAIDPASSFFVIDKTSLENAIRQAFDFRGDKSAGLEINQKQEENLKQEQNLLMQMILGTVDDESAIYSADLSDFPDYTEEGGLPIYYVYWGFIFLILNPTGASWLIFGAASD